MQILFIVLLATLMTGLTAQVHALESANAKSSQITTPAAGGLFLAGPPPGDGPVKVTVNFDLREIDHIDDDEENFEFTGVCMAKY